MSSRHRMFVPALVGFAALSFVAVAVAANRGFKGRVKGAGPVTFQVAAGKVNRFRASMTVVCGGPGVAHIDIYVIAPTGSAKLDREGRFTFRVELPKQQFVDRSGKVLATLYQVRADVKGRLSGRNAAGTAKVSYNRNELSGGRIVIVACTSGKPPIAWTAKQR